jgi:sec-independent protein translocase protein TatB
MFDLGWTEMMLVGIVALIVVGPKELPGLFRTVGHFVGRARGMAREFSRAMEAAADEAGVKEIDRTIRAAARPAQFGRSQVKDAMGLGSKPAAKASPAPLDPGQPLTPAPKPGGATEALAARRAEERARLAERPPAPEAAAPRPATSPDDAP